MGRSRPIMIVGEAPRHRAGGGRGFVGARAGECCGPRSSGAGITGTCAGSRTSSRRAELKSGAALCTNGGRRVGNRLDESWRRAKAKVLVLVGGVSLRRVTGIKKGIQSMRGYVLRPQDCQPVLRRQPVQIGVYKTSRKGSYQKATPKYAVRRVPVPPPAPECEWIISLLHPGWRHAQRLPFWRCAAC